jgi:predicted metal-dependent peptidase
MPGLGQMVYGFDTSGSMTDEQCAVGIGELRGIWQTMRPEKIWSVFCDAEVASVDELDPDGDFEVHPKGGGGTDFRPVFKWIRENMEQDPTALVFFTDGYGTHEPEEPPYPVIWLLIPGSAEDATFPYGRIIRMEE